MITSEVIAPVAPGGLTITSEGINTVDPGWGQLTIVTERINSHFSHGKFKRFLTYFSCMLVLKLFTFTTMLNFH